MGDVVGPGGQRGEASSGLCVGLGKKEQAGKQRCGTFSSEDLSHRASGTASHVHTGFWGVLGSRGVGGLLFHV